MAEVLRSSDRLYSQLFAGTDVAVVAKGRSGWSARDIKTGQEQFAIATALVNAQTLPTTLLMGRSLSGEGRAEARKIIRVVEAQITRSKYEATFYSPDTGKISLVTDEVEYRQKRAAGETVLPFYAGSVIVPEIAALLQKHHAGEKLVVLLDRIVI